jgi:hypothetical protein
MNSKVTGHVGADITENNFGAAADRAGRDVLTFALEDSHCCASGATVSRLWVAL